ncbi:phosphatidylserine/phosphatidylglycerophosphate/cardiolipin synthase-like enzyme [Croceifilum oryzae]|uniref:Phosphatidylserine/phosphatidylglycerophosphate/ cardiolipin synthase-like enzyme n=1 Tax=Croceifilum oryzae TaxID=1553429 RepID=A0AAJ1TK32_9BACL|nr:lamin tail domain-containing protein [Croceifilum oryzae]MDQ0418357.1 phosphatidylserine/phosphatidylglycerophosphate/cardiolipin synthase-like enzyme [Croceifilum oryzae]
MKKLSILFASVVMLISVVFPSSSVVQASPVDHVLITEVYVDTNLPNEPEEYIAVTNPTRASLNIAGWRLTSGKSSMSFPSGTSISPNQTLYITRNASKFLQEFVTITPDFEYGADSSTSTPQMSSSIGALTNSGGEVLLQNGNTVVDAVVYGNSSYNGTGWSGEKIPTKPSGVVTVRDRTESTGMWEDTNTRADFDQLRVYQAGQSRFDLASFTFNGTVTPYTSPDSSFSTLEKYLNSAQKTIDLNVYEFQNTYLLEPMKKAIARGVKVRVFLEGQPVGGLLDQSKYVAQQITNAGGQVRFIISDTTNERYKRYRFNHAKYAIVDGSRVLMQSENWKSTGVPTTNTYGNRGWGIIIQNPDFASYVEKVFEEDWNPSFRDSFPYTPGTKYGEPAAGFVPDTGNPTGNYPSPFPAKNISGAFTVTPIFAPDSTMLQEKAILGMLRNAKSELFVEQLYIHKHWGDTKTGSPESTPNIYLEEMINAARRGVKVRVVLDGSFLDASDPRDNQYTIQYINEIAAREKLDMEAKLFNQSALHVDKIHNKGIIADQKVLVSSINWSRNSPENNREAGVIVENAEVAGFYKDVFLWDFTDGAKKPDPDEGKGKLRISEVHYDTAGNDAVEEYVELYNHSNQTLDMSDYTLSDDIATYKIPSGTTIAPGKRIVIARNQAGFQARFEMQPDIAGMKLSLNNNGDQLTLKDKSGNMLDFVAYEKAPDWNIAAGKGKSISRIDPTVDTDTVKDWAVTNPTPKQ